MVSETERLLSSLRQAKVEVVQHLRTTEREWLWGFEALGKLAVQDLDEVYDEKLWTWLIACGYAAAGAEGVDRLTRALTGGLQHAHRGHGIWFEAQPPTPRRREGNTHLDLALGDLAPRAGTDGGIQAAQGASWACFCEMKWYSDLSGKVTHDVHRNQLARVIENAVAFSPEPLETVHVALVTPAAFRESRSRFYAYKFEEYERDRSALLADLGRCCLEPAYRTDDLEARLDRLHLHWVTFDDLFDGMPESELGDAVKQFRRRFDGTQEIVGR